MSITPTNLLPKFYPYFLGHKLCAENNLKEIDAAFHTLPARVTLKPNVFEVGRWIFKGPRTDGVATTPDTHLYRVRKAEKIRKYLSANKLDAELMVPRKFIYWSAKDNQFYVVSEKVALSQDVVQPATIVLEEVYKSQAKEGGQLKALVDGNPRRELSAVQAKALAELSLLGYTDCSYNNIFFTPEGKVAVIDTEPVNRHLKKQYFRYLGTKGAVEAHDVITGIARLKLYCSAAALKEVERVERNFVLREVAKIIAIIALACFAFYHIPSKIAALSLGELGTRLAIFITLYPIMYIPMFRIQFLVQSIKTTWKNGRVARGVV